MLNILSSLAECHSIQVLEMLTSIPDLTWTPEIPSRFKNMNAQTDRARQIPIAKKQVHSSQKVKIVVDAPSSFSWLQQKPECMSVRDYGICVFVL
ncbi:Cathepsin_B [Hexamita inflata]|uniref:Cathepsin B n=1 Tax=Hexamita inflata TaxID=28002 RepID=A0AA86P0N7_9EUKA|nr:Cathepsin B [Hexamita inflata]